MKKIIISLILILLLGSCASTPNSIYLDTLNQKDTLTLCAEFSDCGEWGGHKEKFIITRNNENYNLVFHIDTVECYTDPDFTRKHKATYSLKNIDIKPISNYIDSLLAKSKLNRNAGHSANYYTMLTNDTVIKFVDVAESWKLFHNLRQKILK